MKHQNKLKQLEKVLSSHQIHIPLARLTAAFHKSLERVRPDKPSDFLKDLLAECDEKVEVKEIDLTKLSVAQLPALAVTKDGEFYIVTNISNLSEAELADVDGAIFSSANVDIQSIYAFSTSSQDTSVKPLRILANLYLEHRKLFLEIVLGSLAVNVIALFTSMFATQVYDRVVPNSATGTLWILASGLFIATAFDFTLRTIRARYLDRISKEVEDAFSIQIFQKIMHAPAEAVPKGAGTFSAQFASFDQARSFFGSVLLFSIMDLPFLVVFIVFIGFINVPVAIVYLIAAPTLIFLGYMGFKIMQHRQEQQLVASFDRQGLMAASIDGFEWIKATHSSWYFMDKWRKVTEDISSWTLKTRSITSMMSNAVVTLNSLIYVFAIIVGVYEIDAGALTVGGLIGCSIVGGRILNPLSNLIPIFQQLAMAKSSLNKIQGIFTLPNDLPQAGSISLKGFTQFTVEVAGIGFRHSANHQWNLRADTLKFSPGEIVGIVGPNGSGKSTLLRILAGIYSPQMGKININDVDYRNVNPNGLREQIGFLPQEIRLFAGTIKENLLLGLGGVSDKSLIEQSELTGLLQSLSASHKGLADLIHEGGQGVSGGQRQLIGLVRVLLSGAKVLILDEPTSMLDTESEVKIVQCLKRLSDEGFTIIFSTHKPVMLELCHRLVLMQGGAVEKILARNAMSEGK